MVPVKPRAQLHLTEYPLRSSQPTGVSIDWSKENVGKDSGQKPENETAIERSIFWW